MNPFNEYVNSRLEEMGRAEMEKNDEHIKQTISLRLTPYRLRMLDKLARELGLSRQGLLTVIIDMGAQQIASAYADTFGDDKSQGVYMDLLEACD